MVVKRKLYSKVKWQLTANRQFGIVWVSNVQMWQAETRVLVQQIGQRVSVLKSDK